MTQHGIKQTAVGRSDLFRLDPKDIHVKDGWNCRDLGPVYEEKIAVLQASIAESGVKQPLTVYWDDGKAYVSDGHRRLDAIKRAMAAGAEIKSVPVQVEDRYASEAERVFSQIVRNSGEPLSPIEQGRVCKRLVDLGWTEADIAKKSGQSRGWIVELLKLQSAPEAIKSLVATGVVSGSLAMKTIRANEGNAAKATSDLTEAVETAKARGKARATPQDVKPPTERTTRPSFSEVVASLEKVLALYNRGEMDGDAAEAWYESGKAIIERFEAA